MNTKLYVGNLSFDASEQDLRDLFADAGEVDSIKIITDRYTGRSRGFAFVEMSTGEEAEKAVSMLNGKQWMDRELKVDEARPQRRNDNRGKRRDGGGHSRGGWR